MDTFMSVLNMFASSAIVVGAAINWRRFDRLNAFEQLGYSAMAMLCSAIVIKAGYNLSMQEFRSDPFGILFRCAFLTYMIGNQYKHMTLISWSKQDHREQVHCN